MLLFVNRLNLMNRLKFRSGLLPALATFALGVYGCFTTESPKTDLAGTSVSTGNPGSVKISFKEGDSPTVFSGKLEIFGATQVPLPDLKPGPLALLTVDTATSAVLSPDKLHSIADSAWPSTSKEGDSIYRFNVVISDPQRATILRDLAYLRKSRKVISMDSLKSDADSNGVLDRDAPLVPLVKITAITKSQSIANYDRYLFIMGTGFIAEGDSANKYTFPSLPGGIHDLKWLTVWKKGLGPASNYDSLLAYDLRVPFSTEGNGVFVVNDTVHTAIPIPPNYRR